MSTEAQTAEFTGFPPQTFEFLLGIAANNEKAWFDAHRADYDAHYLAPAVAFVSALGPRLQSEVSSKVQYEAKVNGSLFRINRDVRFSKDKTPYKTHLDMWFWEGERKGWDSPGYFLRFMPERVILGAGMHHLMPPQLKLYREAVIGESLGLELAAIAAEAEGQGFTVGYRTRKMMPRGFDAAHERARFLLHEDLTATWDGGLPRETGSPAFVDWCVARFKQASPVNDWLHRALKG